MRKGGAVVMKFGGTSVADPEKIQRAAERAVAARRAGRRVAVVVSAPGEMTDELIALAHRVNRAPAEREMDVLMATGEQVSIALFAMACAAKGVPAVSLTGPQAGFVADDRHGRSHILRVEPGRVRSELAAGRIVSVAGFQGLNSRGDVTTLGRGGSDLSAVALAAALKAESCEIYTDVKGVYTADPRLVPEARKLERVSYEEMLELASAGAQVMQPRSIEVARRHGVRIMVRSAFHDSPGTWIVPSKEVAMEEARVSSLSLDKSEALVTLSGGGGHPALAARVLAALAARDIPADMLSAADGDPALSFLTPRSQAPNARGALEPLARGLKARLSVDDQVAKLTAVGSGFRRHPKVAARLFETLARLGTPVRGISSSDLRICCVIDARGSEAALRALHRGMGLGRARIDSLAAT